jgi:hypothetical protein
VRSFILVWSTTATETTPMKLPFAALLLTLACVSLPTPARAQADAIRIVPTSITVTIDASGNVTGNGPIQVYVSRKDDRDFCTKVDHTRIGLEGFSGAIGFYPGQQGYEESVFAYDFTADGWGPGTGIISWFPDYPPYNINLKNAGEQLCNINEWDMAPYPYLLTPFTLHSPPGPINHTAANNTAYPNINNPNHFCDLLGRPKSYTKTFLVRALWDAPDDYDRRDAASVGLEMTINCLAPKLTATTAQPIRLSGDATGKVTGSAQVTIIPKWEGGNPLPNAGSVWAYTSHEFVGVPPTAGNTGSFLVGKITSAAVNQQITGNALQLSELGPYCENPLQMGRVVKLQRPANVYFCKQSADCSNDQGNSDGSATIQIEVDLACAAAPTPPTRQNPVGASSGVLTSATPNVNPGLASGASRPGSLNSAATTSAVSNGVRQAAIKSPSAPPSSPASSSPTSSAPTQESTSSTSLSRDSTASSASDSFSAGASSVAGVLQQAPPASATSAASSFPWGKTWTATYKGSDHVWKLTELQNSTYGFFEDKDQANITFGVDEKNAVRGAYHACGLTGRFDPRTLTVTLDADNDPACLEEFGARFVVKISN